MLWMPPEQWEPYKRGAGCPMCADMHLEENASSFLVTELKQSYVRLPKNQYARGWTRLDCKRHVAELFELDTQELAAFWQDVSQVAHALDTLYRPTKINYCIFGHQVPHLHCHLFLHSYADDPSKLVRMNDAEVWLAPEEYQRMIQELRAQLAGGRQADRA